MSMTVKNKKYSLLQLTVGREFFYFSNILSRYSGNESVPVADIYA